MGLVAENSMGTCALRIDRPHPITQLIAVHKVFVRKLDHRYGCNDCNSQLQGNRFY